MRSWLATASTCAGEPRAVIGRRALLGAGLAAAGGARASAGAGVQPGQEPRPMEEVRLWPQDAPGMPAAPPTERVADDGSVRRISGVATPRMIVLRPERPSGAAALILPGGGYARLVVDKEGHEVGRWLARRGWTVFVLLYRLPGDGWADRTDVPLQDAQRAMRLIRAGAGRFGVDPARAAALGFSAGGHLCADLSTRHAVRTYCPVDAADRLSARPDLAAGLYPVQTMADPFAHRGSRDQLLGTDPSPALIRAHSPENNVAPDTPPFFLAHGVDDASVPVENSLMLRAALRRMRVPVETHLFPEGGHGFGLRRAAGEPAAIWPELFVVWARKRGL